MKGRKRNPQELLFLIHRRGNRPSVEGAAERFDQVWTLCRDHPPYDVQTDQAQRRRPKLRASRM